MNNKMIPQGGNDRIYTPNYLAKQIVNHFNLQGSIVEPCRGKGAFTQYLDCDWFEIDDGKDFYDAEGHWDWLITNPPYSQFRKFLEKSLQVSNNVVYLCLVNAFFMKARLRLIKEYDFGFKEIMFVDTPPKPWPQFGIQLGVVHLEVNYKNKTKITWLRISIFRYTQRFN